MEPISIEIGGAFASGVIITTVGGVLGKFAMKWYNGKNGKPCKQQHCDEHQDSTV